MTKVCLECGERFEGKNTICDKCIVSLHQKIEQKVNQTIPNGRLGWIMNTIGIIISFILL